MAKGTTCRKKAGQYMSIKQSGVDEESKQTRNTANNRIPCCTDILRSSSGGVRVQTGKNHVSPMSLDHCFCWVLCRVRFRRCLVGEVARGAVTVLSSANGRARTEAAKEQEAPDMLAVWVMRMSEEAEPAPARVLQIQRVSEKGRRESHPECWSERSRAGCGV